MSQLQPSLEQALIELVKFKTVTKNQDEVRKAFAYVESLLPPDVFDVHYIENNNVLDQVICWKGQDWRKSKVLINGHMDVVPADDAAFEPRQEGDMLYARGTSDMKGGLVAAVYTFLQLASENKQADCALLFTSDEEVGGPNGAGYITEHEPITSEFVLVVDGPRPNELTITTKEKGLAWIELQATGASAHCARPWFGNNALEKVMNAALRVKKEIDMGEADTWATTATVSILETPNTTTNKVPDKARAVIDIRFTEHKAQNPQELLEKVKKIVGDDATVHLMVSGAMVSTDLSSPYMQKLEKVAREIETEGVIFSYSHAAHDTRYFAGKGLPVALIGTRGANWHAEGEWVDLKSVHRLKELLYGFLKETCVNK